MGRTIKKILKNKRFKIIALLALWIALTIFYVITFDTSFSIWSYNHKNSDIKNIRYDLFDKGETFKGEFTARDNNLGIVAVRFQTYIRPPYLLEDRYLFRIKEKGAKTWYYSNTYRSGLVYDVPFFPFGFPQIINSKGKTYEFEITTTNTNSVNRLSISKRYPVLQTKYKYSGKELLKNPGEMYKFILIKFTNAFKTPDVEFSSFIYIMPLLFYLAWISFLEKLFNPLRKPLKRLMEKLEQNSASGSVIKLFKEIFIYNLDNFLIFIVLVDILFIQLINDVAYLVVAILWIMTLKVYNEDSKKSFIAGLILIGLSPLFLFFRSEPTAEKAGAWALIFLASGLFQLLEESKANYEKPR